MSDRSVEEDWERREVCDGMAGMGFMTLFLLVVGAWPT